jgi:hypothetical protein
MDEKKINGNPFASGGARKSRWVTVNTSTSPGMLRMQLGFNKDFYKAICKMSGKDVHYSKDYWKDE